MEVKHLSTNHFIQRLVKALIKFLTIRQQHSPHILLILHSMQLGFIRGGLLRELRLALGASTFCTKAAATHDARLIGLELDF